MSDNLRNEWQNGGLYLGVLCVNREEKWVTNWEMSGKMMVYIWSIYFVDSKFCFIFYGYQNEKREKTYWKVFEFILMSQNTFCFAHDFLS